MTVLLNKNPMWLFIVLNQNSLPNWSIIKGPGYCPSSSVPSFIIDEEQIYVVQYKKRCGVCKETHPLIIWPRHCCRYISAGGFCWLNWLRVCGRAWPLADVPVVYRIHIHIVVRDMYMPVFSSSLWIVNVFDLCSQATGKFWTFIEMHCIL